MKRPFVMLLSVLAALVSQAATYRISPDAPGGGNGQTWANAMTLEEAIAKATVNGTELHFKAGYYPLSAGLAPQANVAYRGGYAGNDADDEALDAANPISVLDGRDVVGTCITFYNKTGVSGTNVCERMEIRGACSHGVQMTWSGNAAGRSNYRTTVHLLSSRFVANGLNNNVSGNGVAVNGFGAYLMGSLGKPEGIVSNCVFAGNCITTNGYTHGKGDYGCGLALDTWARFRIEDSVFVSNGIPMAATSGISGNEIKGAAFYAQDTPVTLRRCRFAGNRLRATNVSGSFTEWQSALAGFGGGIVVLYGACGGSAFTNCVWTGNVELGAAGKFAGPLLFRLTSKADTVDVVNCTFGYNLTDSINGSAGIKACRGTANVLNSIFCGNRVGTVCTGGRDLAVGTDGAINVDWSLLSEDGKGSYGESADIDTGDNLIFGNAGFATAEEDYEDLLVPTINGSKVTYSIDFTRADEFAALDCHLRSSAGYVLNSGEAGPETDENSQSIDAGDPKSDWALEPEPNGSRINLGAYGNTPVASKTATVEPPSIDGEVNVSFVGEWTQPEISFKIAESGSASQAISAKIYVAENDAAYQQAATVGDLIGGSSVLKRLSDYFTSGATLHVKVVLSGVGFDDQSFETTKPVVGTKPIWAGKGGDAEHIIHLRPGATGKGDGSSWTDACTNLTDALALYSSVKKEIWFAAGELQLSAGISFYAEQSATCFRGGFTGAECSPEERTGNERTVLDGKNEFNPFSLTTPTRGSFYIDRFRFVRGKSCGLSAQCNATLTFRDCEFVCNGTTHDGNVAGQGLSVNYTGGGYSSTISISNCLFAGNVVNANCRGLGAGFYTARAASLKIIDSTFLTNGVAIPVAPGATGRRISDGAAINAEGNSIELKGCRFAGNRAQNWRGSASVVYLGGLATVRNCAFVGNECTHCGDNQSQGNTFGGALAMSVPDGNTVVENCTFAGNLADGVSFAAGLTASGSGSLRVRNSIFYGNRLGKMAQEGLGRDLFITGTVTADVDYCLFAQNSTACFTFGDNVSVNLGSHGVYKDPKFMSRMSQIRMAETGNYMSAFAYDSADELVGLNVHLATDEGYLDENSGKIVKVHGYSPAIDAGDPASDWTKEPPRNGKCINLGYYGNTPYASRSHRKGFILMIDGKGRPEQPGEYTPWSPDPVNEPVDSRPRINVSNYLPGSDSCVLDSIEALRVSVNAAKASGEVVLSASQAKDEVSVALNRGAVFLTGGTVAGERFSGITKTESTARGNDMTEAFPYRWLVEGPYFGYMNTGIPQVAGGLLKVNRDKIRANGGKAVDLVMLGDSISHFWPVNGPTSWATLDGNWSVFDFGGGSDRVQDTLYVAKWGYLDGYTARLVSIMVGVNNIRDNASSEAIASGISSLIGIVRAKQPGAKILLHAVLPYDAAGSAVRTKVAALNALLKPLADGTTVVWVDMTDDFINADGTFKSGMIRSDSIHPDEGGYAVWLGRLQQYLQQ